MTLRRVFVIAMLTVFVAAFVAVLGATEWNAERSSSPIHAVRVEREPTTDQIPTHPEASSYADLATIEYVAAMLTPTPVASSSTRSVGDVARGPSPGTCAGDVDCFLSCTRAHESDTSGGYAAVSPDGTYRGAYQFDAGTWRGAVTRAGFEEYADTPVDQVPPDVQDAAAIQLYGERGTQPWGGRC